MLRTPFPLPELWCTDLPWFFLAIYAPIVTAERVVMRCGEKMVSLRPEDGSIEWASVVDPEDGNGAVFLAHAGQYITEKARLPECLATILAVDAAGRERWRTDLSAMLALGSAVVVDDQMLALSLGAAREETILYQLDLATGAVRGQHALRWQADGLVPVPGGLVARNQEASGDAPGLYRMSQAGTEPTPMLQEPVRYLEGAGAHLLALSQAEAGAPCMVHVYRADGLEAQWSAPARTEAAALDGDDVFHVADADGGASEHGVLVARDARTGAERWRSAPLTTKITAISVGGPVVLCNHRQGQVLYRRTDGGLIGTMRGSYGPPTVVGTRMYICRPRALLCASLEAL